MMASKNKDERALVNQLTAKLLRDNPTLHVHIDRDSGSQRHTSSGWDFLLVYDGRVVFCEAKIEKGKLSSWQELIRAKIQISGTLYNVVRFWENGKFFTVDDRKMIAISDAKLTDFL